MANSICVFCVFYVLYGKFHQVFLECTAVHFNQNMFAGNVAGNKSTTKERFNLKSLKKKTKKTQLKKKNFLVHSGNEQLSCHMLCLKKEFN